MKTLDRLGWAKGMCVSVLGIPIGLRANDDAALDQAIEHLPMTRIVPSTRSTRRKYSIFVSPPSRRRIKGAFIFSLAEPAASPEAQTWVTCGKP